jgi:BirA family biotin operon repressor/biotin-[acetyl-CoA-carboxylase] ligase
MVATLVGCSASYRTKACFVIWIPAFAGMSGFGVSAMGLTPILTFETLDSTNAEARRRAESGERGPVWLLARQQTAGKGRRGRVWNAGQGNLTATLLLTLDKPSLEAAQLAFVAALAVGAMADAFVATDIVGFKWPNDILIEGRKVSGMLIESGAAPGGGLWLAVGIGVNLVDFPPDVERPATALALHLRPGATSPTQDDALARLSAAFADVLALWLEQGFEPIRRAWLSRAIGMGGPCTARLPHETVVGVAEGLDADGALLLRLENGAVRRITAGDVFFGAP